MFVDTIETLRQQYLLNKLIQSGNRNVLLIGPTGTGKSNIINSLLNKITSNYAHINLNFSARTDLSQTQDLIMSKLIRLIFNYIKKNY